nr:uncharacterized protein LOC104086648 [Nicotiana tomentosiformis]
MQDEDLYLAKFKEGVRSKETTAFTLGSDRVLKLNDRLCVPDVDGLRKAIMEKSLQPEVLYPPRFYQNVSGLERVVLVKRHEEVTSRSSGQMFELPAIKKRLGTKVNLSPAFHPQTDEFAYNNSCQASIDMAPYEALYGRRCTSPVGWFEPAEVPLIDLEFVCEALEKVQLIRERLKAA